MEVKFLNQPKEVRIGEILRERLRGEFNNIYIIAGMAKDTGIEDIYDALLDATSNSKKVSICIGIDRKNTSKDMLMRILDAGCSLSVHINTDESKVESRAYVFECEKGISYIYMTGSKFSSGGLFDNASIITEVKYEKGERKAFEIAKNNILQGVVSEFHQIDKDEVILLAERGDIVARITDRKIPRINEMYGDYGVGTIDNFAGENVYDENTSVSSLKLDELEDIEIEFEPGIVIRKEVELATENEVLNERKEKEKLLKSLKKTESDLEKLYKKKQENTEIKRKTSIKKDDGIDFENMTTLVIEANKIAEKGVGAGEFKIPKSIAENLNNYFENDTVKFLILDNSDNTTYEDESVNILKSEKGISILSNVLIKLMLNEGDIVRIIKENKDKYKCEIIRIGTEEYNIWSCYCVHSIRGQKRKFGIN